MCCAVALVLTAGACSNDGRALRPPPDGAVYPDPNAPVTDVQYSDFELGLDGFRVSSDDISPGGEVPDLLACNGAATRLPELSWERTPANARELAIVVTDLDAAGLFRQWIVVGIDSATTSISAGGLPPGALVVAGDSGAAAWEPPCPATEVHHIRFAVHALREPANLVATGTVLESMARIEAITITESALTATVAPPS